MQPDGEVLPLFATGNAYYNWVHDKDNYTVVRDPDTGVVEYAHVENDKLVPSGYRVGTTKPSAVGLQPGTNVFPDRQQVASMRSRAEPPYRAPTSGTINNLVVFIRFSEESEFTDTVSFYDSQSNTSISSRTHYYNDMGDGRFSVESRQLHPQWMGAAERRRPSFCLARKGKRPPEGPLLGWCWG